MPLIDLGPTLGIGRSAFEGSYINVVVCSYGDTAVGLAVHQILDIVLSSATQPTDTERSVIIDGQITDFVDPIALIAAQIPLPEPSMPSAVSATAEGIDSRQFLLAGEHPEPGWSLAGAGFTDQEGSST